MPLIYWLYHIHFTDLVNGTQKEKKIKELHCSILDFVLGSSAALCHKVGNFWDQGERTFSLTKKEHRCCASMLATACAAATEEGKGLWPFLSLPAVHCQCAGWMETLLLCWCRNLPSPFLVHSCRGWDIPICCWVGCQRSCWLQVWNRWSSCSLYTYRLKKTHRTTIFHERLTCQITAVTCTLPTRAASSSAC